MMKRNCIYYRRSILFLSILFYLNMFTYSQNPGFIGNKSIVGLGLSYNSHFDRNSNDYLHDNVIPSTLPLKSFLQYEHVFTNRTSFYSALSFYPLPNTSFYIAETNIDYGDAYTFLVIDTFQLKSDLFSLNLGFQKYKEFAPYGKYFSYGCGGNYFKTTIYPTTYVKEIKKGVLLQNYIVKSPVGRQFTYNMNLWIGKGRKVFMSDYLVLDYGMRCYAFLGRYKFTNLNYKEGEFDHRESENLRDVIDYMNNKSAMYSHLFEVYFLIQLLK